MDMAALTFLSDRMNGMNATWGVGGSLLLYFYGLVQEPNDIDLLVAEPDMEKLHRVFQELGEYQPFVPKSPFCTKKYCNYTILGANVDVMAGYSIEHDSGIYLLDFDSPSVTRTVRLGDSNVPLSALEDWYVLYQLIPGKQYKAEWIAAYFQQHGIPSPFLLENALNRPLPQQVKQRIENLLTL
jgi:hypothetical protein